jgi:signal transduction histidine kinase
MTLRRRLTLALVATAVPFIGGLVWWRAETEQRASERVLRELAQLRVEAIGRERCEAAPAELDRLAGSLGSPPPGEPGLGPRPPFLAFGTRLGPRPGPMMRWRPMLLSAYDAAFQSRDAAAPTFPVGLRPRFEAGARFASALEQRDGERLHVFALRTGWSDGPCAFVVARGPVPRRLPREVDFIATASMLCVALLAAVWFAVGSVIRRVHALASDMRASAATHYRHLVAVEGHDEIADLARTFNAAGGELRAHLLTVETREEALRSFLANTTHDVMIPLTVLQGHLSLLRRQIDQCAPDLTQHVHAAAEEAAHIGALVHNLGAAAKLEAGEGIVRRDTVDLSALVERIVERHRPLAEPRGISIAFAVPPDSPVRVLGDLTLLEQAVGNIVANAVRYNNAAGHVAVSLETPLDEPRRFRLRIVDDGPGVADAELARLGERHFRGQTGRARHQEGQGLGLHIARTVAERHDFALRFARPDGGGLEVQLVGPLAAGPEP